MVAEWGVCCLVIALGFALMMVVVPAFGFFYNNRSLIATIHRLTNAYVFFTGLSFALLVTCFLLDDFTVRYVFLNSSLHLPWFYKLCAAWGGHEGSMLLWTVILSGWMLAVRYFDSGLTLAFKARVLMVLALISAGFLLFLLCVSNPFLREFSVLNSGGRDLNPLLQDLGFLFHPPMLYMGYVGFAVAFAFAIAALWSLEFDTAFAKWARPWTLVAWCCLTVGITLGSWWAYRELGWGGWWFWDPVENASFMPWLSGTALLHSLMVCEKRRQFVMWTMWLAITTFSLSLMGTFLVRSGVLTSVHAFAVDPARGLYILAFLVCVVGGALLLFCFRAKSLCPSHAFAVVSKESALLLNNVFLCAAMLTVLLGTTYPLLIDALNLGKLSVGAPYFNAVFIPLMLPVLLFMGLGIHVRWQSDDWRVLLQRLTPVMLGCVGVFLIWWVTIGFARSVVMALGVLFSMWVALSTLYWVYQFVMKSGRLPRNASFWGMVCAHLGVAVTVMGIAVSSGLGQSEDVAQTVGEQQQFAGFTLRFLSETPLQGPNYQGTRAAILVQKGRHEKTIYPEKRLYTVGQMALSESDMDVTPFRDLYVALGEPLGEKGWSLRLYYKPLVRWIWAGGLLMALGGLMALADRRYVGTKTI